MKKQFQILSTPAFIIGLILLLLNDWVLKDLFHNWATGKLSDFAGMFIFPLFWVALFPRLRIHAFWASAIWFIYWKSPYSQSLIDGWNDLGIYTIQRVVDITDLLALLIVPLAYLYWKNGPYAVWFRLHPVVPLSIAALAFMATSKGPHTVSPKESFLLPFPKDTLKLWLPALDSISQTEGFDDGNPDTIKAKLKCSPEVRQYDTEYDLVLIIAELSNLQTILIIKEAKITSHENDSILFWVVSDFKNSVINPLLEKHHAITDSLRYIP